MPQFRPSNTSPSLLPTHTKTKYVFHLFLCQHVTSLYKLWNWFISNLTTIIKLKSTVYLVKWYVQETSKNHYNLYLSMPPVLWARAMLRNIRCNKIILYSQNEFTTILAWRHTGGGIKCMKLTHTFVCLCCILLI